MIWRQTARQWGNDRTIYGVAHAFPDVPGVPRALCGYSPHEHTRLVQPWVGRYVRCEQCVRKAPPE